MPDNISAIKYLLVINGKPEGPFSIDELKQHKIKPSDFVISSGMDDYKEAHEVEELRELLGFSKQHILPQYFAGFDQRWMASALDWFMVSLVIIFFGVITLLFISEKSTQIIIAANILGIIPIVNFIYHVVMEASTKQGTYGKQILKIKVTDIHGERVGFGRSFGRNLAKIFSVITLFIGYLYSFFNTKQQCLHDVVAGTLVIKDRLI
ncbi:MAG: RDD family protein [Sphingobacteriales bacterium]